MAASGSRVLLILLVGVSAMIDGGAVSSDVAELESERWREKLPGVSMPETLLDRLSPLSLTQLHYFAAGLKMNNVDAREFCRSAGLICGEDVDFPGRVDASDYGIPPSTEDRANKEHVFFDKKELRVSGRIRLPDLSLPSYMVSFLPRELAEMMPSFSSANISEIQKLLNISKESQMSRGMAETLQVCEKRLEEGEVKRCSTSIEGMVEFVLSHLGSDVDLFTDTSEVGYGEQVIVTKVSRRENIKSPMTCHGFGFPYGVRYCHSIKGSEVFDMELEDMERVKRKGRAVCHYFKPNGTAGGYLAACHPVFGEMLLWTPKPNPH